LQPKYRGDKGIWRRRKGAKGQAEKGIFNCTRERRKDKRALKSEGKQALARERKRGGELRSETKRKEKIEKNFYNIAKDKAASNGKTTGR